MNKRAILAAGLFVTGTCGVLVYKLQNSAPRQGDEAAQPNSKGLDRTALRPPGSGPQKSGQEQNRIGKKITYKDLKDKSPAELIAMLDSVKDKNDAESRDLEMDLMRKLTKEFPEQALNYVQANYSDRKKEGALKAVFSRLFELNSAAATERLSQLEDSRLKGIIAGGLLANTSGKLGYQALSSMLGKLNESELARAACEGKLAAESLYEIRPDLFESALKALPMTSAGVESGVKMLVNLSQTNPLASAKFLISNPELQRDDKKALFEIGVNLERRKETGLLMDLLNENPKDKDILSSMMGAASMFKKDANDSTQTIPKEIDTKSFAEGAFGIRSSFDSTVGGNHFLAKFLAKDLALENGLFFHLSSENQIKYADEALEDLARRDATAALELHGKLNSRDKDDLGYQGLVAGWIALDPSGASEWISGLPKGNKRSLAIRAMLPLIEKTDPESFAQWKSELQQP